jgi:hypothetical protein
LPRGKRTEGPGGRDWQLAAAALMGRPAARKGDAKPKTEPYDGADKVGPINKFTSGLLIVWCNDLLCVIPIHVFAVANTNDKNDKCIVEDFVYNSIVACANSK